MQRGLKRASYVLLAVLLVALWALPGCAETDVTLNGAAGMENSQPPGKQELVTLYFQTEEGYLVPYNVPVPADGNAPRHAIEKLLAGPPETEFLVRTLPEGLLIRDLYVKNGIACLDLGGALDKISGDQAWRSAVESILFTLTEFPDIEAVQILLDGKEAEAAGGVALQKPLKRPPALNRIPGGVPEAPEVCLYFSYRDAYPVPVTISLDPNTKDVLQATLLQLIAGPQGIPGLSPVFPEGTRLLGYERQDDLLRLDFSEEAVLRDKTNSQRITLVALAYTLRQFPDLKEFEVQVKGKPLNIPGLKQPIRIPRTYRDWFTMFTTNVSRGMARLLPISG